MSIAEKLVTIAENTPKVCDAVNAAKREVNGNVVVAHDISTIEHPLEVKLTKDVDTSEEGNEIPTDFSGVTVKQSGKNQVDFRNNTWYGANCSEKSRDGEVITAKGDAGSRLNYSSGCLFLRFNETPVIGNNTITISLYVTLLEQGIHDNYIRLYVANAKDSTTGSGGNADVALTLNERTRISFTRTPSFDTAAVIINLNNNKIKAEMDTLQIEYGYEATEFEAYKEPTAYTANADGTVDGVMSLAPSMTLVSSDPEATINCRYFPVNAVGVRTAYAELVDAETALRDRLLQRGGE